MRDKTKNLDVVIGLRLDKQTNQRLLEVADKKERKPSELARIIVRDYLKAFYE